MTNWFEGFVARAWNARHRDRERSHGTLELGTVCSDDGKRSGRLTIPQDRRAEHIAILGKTGLGKSYLIRYLARQDIAAKRGFCCFDLHGDLTPFILACIAERERIDHCDLSERTVVIEPSDPEYSVGLNPLEDQPGASRFVQIAEFTQLLKQRWQLDSFGARTDELLRNTLHVLSDNGLTLLEAGLLLSNEVFRSTCLKAVGNAEVRQYFELRYDTASEPMRAVMREPILNKLSAFTADPRFRAIIGQQRSTFSIAEAFDRGQWIILNLHKGRLGEQAATLGSLFLAKVKNALFARTGRNLFTLYADEIQNLVAYGSGLETTLSEARKFGIGVVAANQYLDQYPADMRAAVMAVGTHVLFQLSPEDAQQAAMAFDGGKPLAERLKNLPRRHMVVKTGSERWREAEVLRVAEPQSDWADLYERCRLRWARKRADIESEITRRQAVGARNERDLLNDWE